MASSHFLLAFTAAGGVFYWLILASLLGSSIALEVSRPIWLRHWIMDPKPAHLNFNLSMFAVISFTGIPVAALRFIWSYGIRQVGFVNRGSRIIHSILLDRICAAPLSFFESTPAGRIMNVFGQDMNRIDSSVAEDFGRTRYTIEYMLLLNASFQA